MDLNGWKKGKAKEKEREREREREREMCQQARSFLWGDARRAFCVVNGLSPAVTLFGRFCSMRARDE
jgi:hypothetical protein